MEFSVRTKQNATETNRNKQHNFRILYEMFAIENPTKTTPSMMKLGDNTPHDVYKHPKLKLLKNVEWFDHKSNFTTHIQFELFL